MSWDQPCSALYIDCLHSSVCRGSNLDHLSLRLGDYMLTGEISVHPSFRRYELLPKNRLELDMAYSSIGSCYLTETMLKQW